MEINLGNIIKHIRLDHNYKQEFVAKHLNISQTHYSKHELNKVNPSIHFMMRLADLYKCTIDDIINDNVKSPRKPETGGGQKK